MNADIIRVDAHARAVASLTVEPVNVGGFTAFFGDEPYAVPIRLPDDAEALERDVAALLAEFDRRGVAPRVELSVLASRALPAALSARGLVVLDEAPLLVCRPAGLRPRPGTAQVRWVTADDDLAFVASVMRQGFEIRGSAEGAAAGLAAALAGPLRLALATVNGAPAGSGSSTPLAGVTEIASVSTLPNLRRRGVAAAIVSFLTAGHFAAGGELAWACAPDARAAALFLDVGFEDAGLRLGFGRG